MSRVTITSCLVTAGLTVYGAVSLAGLAAGLSFRPSLSGAPRSPSSEGITVSEVIASRFPAATSQDLAPAQAAIFRAAFLRADGITTPSSRTLRSAALRYGVLESALWPSELAPTGTAAVTVSLAVAYADEKTSWHEAFIGRILPADQAANFAVVPATAVATTEGGGVATRLLPAAAESNAKPQVNSTPSPVAPQHRRPRPGGVLNDVQIANIKSRLNLSPEQEAMWPAVEAALRNISYAKTAVAQAQASRDSRMAYVDPNGPEVQQLKYAALPLIMRLSDDQKREVKSLAHVMGLDGLLNAASAWF